MVTNEQPGRQITGEQTNPVREALEDALDEALEDANEALEPAVGESASVPSSA